jgi:hypothetical protein
VTDIISQGKDIEQKTLKAEKEILEIVNKKIGV